MFQCYYHKTMNYNGRRYIGERVDTERFVKEKDAEEYCCHNVGITEYGDGTHDENEMRYEEIDLPDTMGT